MKVCLGFAVFYMVLGLCLGVFAREYTKRKGLDPAEAKKTNLIDLHPHTLILGMFMFLILSIFGYFSHSFAADRALFIWFMIFYNIGVLGTVFMLFVRGMVQLSSKTPGKKENAMISGCAGLMHIILSVGLILLFCTLYHCL
ncbi:MAG: DUF2871 family protein [Aeriscardovia sp.]|nr:DUF2871 family protein [Aeriscardovia sp.]MBQ1556144.1 DUF2871 family protein [Aeriscardovia sp.]